MVSDYLIEIGANESSTPSQRKYHKVPCWDHYCSLHINDLDNYVNFRKLALFADGTSYVITEKNLADLKRLRAGICIIILFGLRILKL